MVGFIGLGLLAATAGACGGNDGVDIQDRHRPAGAVPHTAGPVRFTGPWPELDSAVARPDQDAEVTDASLDEDVVEDVGAESAVDSAAVEDADSVVDTGVVTNDAEVVVEEDADLGLDTRSGDLGEASTAADSGVQGLADSAVEDSSVVQDSSVEAVDSSIVDAGRCGVPNGVFRNHGACVSWCAHVCLPQQHALFVSCHEECDCEFDIRDRQ